MKVACIGVHILDVLGRPVLEIPKGQGIALIEEILCAKKALAVNLDNSDDHTFVVNILSTDTQFAYTSTSACIAF